MFSLLIDLDGVVYNAGQPIEGAVETIAKLRADRIPFLFVTNTTSRPRQQLVDELTDMGIAVRPEEIFTPAIEACQWLRRKKIQRAALYISDSLKADFQDLPLIEDHNDAEVVIIGNLGTGWDYNLLNEAFQVLIHHPGTRLLALGKPRYWLVGDKLRLDSGPFVAALEYATGKRSLVLGKPARSFFTSALELLGTQAHQAVMIGDDLAGDVEGAQKSGLRGILVRTGKFRPADLERDVRPDAVLPSIAQLPAWLEEHL